MNQFDIFKTVLSGSELDSSVTSKMQSFLFLRWLSGDRRVIQSANLINLYYAIPENVQYMFFRKMLFGKLKFIKYPKSPKAKPLEQLELISKHYKVSLELASEMAELISNDEVAYLTDLYK